MNTNKSDIRLANSNDLDVINQIITTAVMSWTLPERVKRLSLTSYHYKDVDLQFLQIYVVSMKNTPIAVLALDNELIQLSNNRNALLIHGLYVDTYQQGRGIGRYLITFSEQQAKLKNANALLVKAQKDAESFFLRMGMQKLQVEDESRDYQARYCKIIS